MFARRVDKTLKQNIYFRVLNTGSGRVSAIEANSQPLNMSLSNLDLPR